MKERLYRAITDDGHDYGTFTFYSRHKAGSMANYYDALDEERRLGRHHKRIINITRED